MAFTMWQSLKGGAGSQGMQFNGVTLELAGSSATTISVPAADLVSMLRAALDSAVLDENSTPRGDRFKVRRDAIGGAVGSTHTGFTYATTTSQGTVMTRTSGSIG